MSIDLQYGRDEIGDITQRFSASFNPNTYDLAVCEKWKDYRKTLSSVN